MEKQRFTIDCPGAPCPLHTNPASHSHMPPQETLPNRLTVNPAAAALAERIIKSYTGLAGDEETAWAKQEIEELERDFTSSSLGAVAIKAVSI